MKHLLLVLKSNCVKVSLLLMLLAAHLPGHAQVTITTTGTGYDGSNNGGAPGAITFAITNNNTSAVLISALGTYLTTADGGGIYSLWYNPTTLTGAPTISTAGGWTQITTGTAIAAPGVNGITQVLSGMSFSVPAGATYRFALTSTITIRYSGGTSTPTVNIFSGGGVDLLVYNNTTSPGYAGTTPSPVNTPRAFTGFVTFAPATPCTGTPSTPVITTAALTTPICPTATTTITATNGTSGSQVFNKWEMATSSTGPWSAVTGGTGGTTLSYTTAPQATTMYYRLKDSCGASNATNVSAVYTVPVAPAQITNTTPGQRCGPGTVTLSATGTGTGFNWYTVATGGTPVATGSTYTTPSISANTTYYVSSTNGTCESARTAVLASVNGVQTATATPANSVTQCTGGSTIINANTGTGLTYQWQLNGANITGATSSSYTATASGNYTVVVTNTTSGGCVGTSNIVTVTIGASPASGITPAGTANFCPGSTTTLSATNTGTGLSYQWNLNGSPISGATAATYAVSTAGSYTVTVSSSGTCSSTSTTPTVASAYAVTPAVINTPNGTAVCPGGTLPLNVTNTTGALYQWSLNGTTITGATNPTYSVSTAGSYTVAVTYAGTSGCTATSQAVVVTTATAPTATASLLAGTTGCDSVGFSANTGTNLTYQWLMNGTAIPGATTQVYYGHATGSYTVKVTNGSGCSTTSSAVSIVVNNSPVSFIYANGPTTFCAGSVVQLQVPAGTGLTYQWKNNGVNIPGATTKDYLATTSGAYTVQIGSSAGCSYSAQPVNITVNPIPTATISFNSSNYLLSVNGNYVYTAYHWYFNNQPLTSGSALSNTYTAASTGSYFVAVMDSNGCVGISTAFYVPDTSFHPSGTPNVSAIRNAIKVFPNPATDRINIEAPVAVNVNLRDLSGKLILEEKNAKMLNVSQLRGGLYLLMITDAEGHMLRVEKITKVD